MSDSVPALGRTDFVIERLSVADADRLQDLFVRCTDFAMLIDGRPSEPGAARREFEDTPPGRTVDDIFLFGVREKSPELVGVLQFARHYPDADSWLLGLLLLDPRVRSRGLGESLCRAAERWVAERGARWLWLSVVEPNTRALQFWKRMGFEPVRRTEPRTFGVLVHTVDVLRRRLETHVTRSGGVGC